MAPNLLLNSAFDLDADGDFLSSQNGVPDNWIKIGAPDIFPWFDQRLRQMSSGDTIQEVHLNEAVGANIANGAFLGLLQSPIPVTPGVIYCLSIYTFVQFLAGAGSLKFMLSLQFRDAGGAALTQSDFILTPTNYNDAPWATTYPGGTASDVKRPYVVRIAPPTAASAYVWILLLNDTGAPVVGTTTHAYFGMAKLEAGLSPTPWDRNQVDNFGGHTWPFAASVDEQITRPYQYHFNGLKFGAGTGIIVENLEGLLSGAPVRDLDMDRAGDHGAYAGMQYLSKRTLSLTLKVTGTRNSYLGDPNDIQTKLDRIKAAFQPNRVATSLVPIPFYFWHRNQQRKFLNVRCTKREISSDYLVNQGLAEVDIELVATDPFIYSVFRKMTTLTIPSGGTTKVQNQNAWSEGPVDGDAVDGAQPIIELFGPMTNPVVGSQTENRFVRLQTVVAAGQKVRINVKTKTVEKDVGAGYVEDYSIVRSDSQWFRLLPGVTNTLQVTRTDSPATTAKAVFTWNDVWN